ncbi:MAG: T9SS type A sorting domain-containing protein [Calditrichia bacterium]
MKTGFQFLSSILLLFLINNSISAQNTELLWSKFYGGDSSEAAYSMQKTSDNGFILTGYTKTRGSGNSDLWMLRLDENGDTLWTKVMGDTGRDLGISVCQTTDGGFITAGSTEGPNNTGYDGWLIKSSENGTTEWQKIYGGVSHDVFYAVQQTADGGFILAGSNIAVPGRKSDIWVVRTDEAGAVVWEKRLTRAGADVCYGIEQTSDSGFVLVGRVSVSSSDTSDVWIGKMNVNGDTLWTRTYGGSGTDIAYRATELEDGGFALVGKTDSFGAGASDLWLIRTDHSGNLMWSKTYGSVGKDRGISITELQQGDLLICGETATASQSTDAWVLLTDSNGDTLWTSHLGGPGYEVAYSIEPLSNSQYVLAGYSTTLSGNADVWMAKIKTIPLALESLPATVSGGYKLFQNYPNPFNPSTTISFSIPATSPVRLDVFNLAGQKVAALLNTRLSPGEYQIPFNGAELSSGIYTCILQAGSYRESRKMILLK